MWLYPRAPPPGRPLLSLCVCVCQGGLTASAVRHLVALQSEEIKLVASEYAEKVAPPPPLTPPPVLCLVLTCGLLPLQQWELSTSSGEERFGPAQQRRRAVASLEKHLQQKTQQLQQVRGWSQVWGQGCSR